MTGPDDEPRHRRAPAWAECVPAAPDEYAAVLDELTRLVCDLRSDVEHLRDEVSHRYLIGQVTGALMVRTGLDVDGATRLLEHFARLNDLAVVETAGLIMHAL